MSEMTDEAKNRAPDTMRGPLAEYVRSLKNPLRPGDSIPLEVIEKIRAQQEARMGFGRDGWVIPQMGLA